MVQIKSSIYRRSGFYLIILAVAYMIFTSIENLPALAMAQDLDMFMPEFFSLKKTIIGFGAGLAPEYEGADEFKAFIFPEFKYNWNNGCYVNLLGPALRANMVPNRIFSLGPMVRYRPERGSVEDKVAAQFKKIDSATEAGLFGSMVINSFLFYIAMNNDVSDVHKGYLIDAAGGYRVLVEYNVQFIILALGTYASDKYMETYFGVDEENSHRSGLPVFQAEGGLKDIGLLAALQYKINSNWGILGTMKYTRLLGDAMDSPIVKERGDSNNFMDGIAVNYSY